MSDITPINGVPVTPAERAQRPNFAAETAPIASVRTADRVDLSRAATYLSTLLNGPDVRAALVERVRGEIDAGVYVTPEKIETLLDELLADF